MCGNKSILHNYDRLYQKYMVMRVIVAGAASIMEKYSQPIYTLIAFSDRKELRCALEDIATAVFWLQEELMDFSTEEQ